MIAKTKLNLGIAKLLDVLTRNIFILCSILIAIIHIVLLAKIAQIIQRTEEVESAIAFLGIR